MTKMIYWGLFLTDRIESVYNAIENQHITCGYRCAVPASVEFGSFEWVEVVGYGKNSTNEGLEVVAPSVYMGADTPHITLGVANGGKPVETANLDFESCEHFRIPARWGWFGSDREVHFY